VRAYAATGTAAVFENRSLVGDKTSCIALTVLTAGRVLLQKANCKED
jgi:hypothetical protein